uniref:Uncharacterized protein n=1 Tax=Rhizophagus irregularis (strain DAOM 181602 / DAOM 197198 / MUCL 43194) TaxID=747089 RepID=U9SMZ5_RHIID
MVKLRLGLELIRAKVKIKIYWLCDYLGLRLVDLPFKDEINLFECNGFKDKVEDSPLKELYSRYLANFYFIGHT